MGIDAEIYIKTSDGDLPDKAWEIGYKIVPHLNSEWFSHTVALHHNDRYYSESYARGHWPYLCGVLLELLSSSNITAVWYCADCDDIDSPPEPLSHERLLELTRFYLKNGNSTYWMNRVGEPK